VLMCSLRIRRRRIHPFGLPSTPRLHTSRALE
jgi:hypothetical protein